nr:unnamed protein product [Digitaria exilis]
MRGARSRVQALMPDEHEAIATTPPPQPSAAGDKRILFPTQSLQRQRSRHLERDRGNAERSRKPIGVAERGGPRIPGRTDKT